MLPKLVEIKERFELIEQQLMDPAIVVNPAKLKKLGKARASLEPLVDLIKEYEGIVHGLEDAEEAVSDPEMKEMALEEIDRLRPLKEEAEERLKIMLLPKDPNDDRSVIIEIRPAAGGDEAGLFAYDLFRMYALYAEKMGWKSEVMDLAETGVGGASRAVIKIDQDGAYSQLKHESGVHRVQRVPATESQGRIHTSTVTVAVMPEADEVDVQVDTKDLEISAFRSSSAGGQHMQKNDTAIRIVHIPTGTVVTCQDERSQAQNKIKAMTVLRTRLYEAALEAAAEERGELRRGKIGSGDRSEKIRTYNFPQDRISDHRIGLNVHGVPLFLGGDIQKMIDALVQEEQARLIAEQQDSAADA
jgi:peptide chain release factor 1